MNENYGKMPVRVAQIQLSDTTNPLLRIQYVAKDKTPETPNDYSTITIAATGSSTSKLLVTLKIGEKNALNTDLNVAASTTYEFSASGVAVASGATEATTTTLGALVDALNAIDGVVAERLNAPADYSLDTDDFAALSETRIGPLFKEVLYKDADQVLTSAVRFGIPNDIKGKVGAGSMEILFIRAYVNSNSDTDCTFKLSRDPTSGAGGASDEVELPFTRYVPDAAWTELFDLHECPPVFQGPLLAEVTATSSMATTVNVLIGYRSVEV